MEIKYLNLRDYLGVMSFSLMGTVSGFIREKQALKTCVRKWQKGLSFNINNNAKAASNSAEN